MRIEGETDIASTETLNYLGVVMEKDEKMEEHNVQSKIKNENVLVPGSASYQLT